MPIELEGQGRQGLPVVKKSKLGEVFVGAVVKFEQRNRQRADGTTITNARGKPSQELVVTCLSMPKTTATVGLGEKQWTPEPGEACRLIVNGKSFAGWIEQRGNHRDGRLLVGDVVIQQINVAQAYDAGGQPKGGEITDQADVERLRMSGQTLGLYGPITLVEPKDPQWVQAAEQAYQELSAITLPEQGAGPFDTPTSGAGVDPADLV
jgi:hypothetical protein